MKSLLLIVCIVRFFVATAQEKEHEHKPEIQQNWIYTMIAFGFIGFVLISSIIVFAAVKTYQMPSKYTSNKLIILIFTLWICNALACAMWALSRTDLFITLNPTKCTIIYITNYLFYMFAKYFLHITLIYRLYIAFKGTVFKLHIATLRILITIISINFVIFSSLWFNTCIANVTIGVTVPEYKLHVCTLFNNDSNKNMDTFHKIWPTLLGAQDLIIGVLTLTLFMFKIYCVYMNPTSNANDVGLKLVIRRLFVSGVLSICSTFIFYTFAIPFYGNLTFLLPLDALINSFCILLVSTHGQCAYSNICCACDWLLKQLMNHEEDAKSMENVLCSVSPASPNSPSDMKSTEIKYNTSNESK